MSSISYIELSRLTNDQFLSLNDEEKTEIYQQANMDGNIQLVARLNFLGMKPAEVPVRQPSIISECMDVATQSSTILEYLKTLYKDGRLIVGTGNLPEDCNWMNKGPKFERLLGRDYLAQMITQLGLQRVRVPRKVVVAHNPTISVECWNDQYMFHMESNEMTVFAERVSSVSRKLTREEIDDLIRLIAAANFTDLWPANIALSEDHVYVIDTETKSFKGNVCWDKIHRFKGLVKSEDIRYFEDRIIEMEKLDTGKWYYQFWDGTKTCKMDRRAKYENEIDITEQQYMYVGGRSSGPYSPLVFKYSIDEL